MKRPSTEDLAACLRALLPSSNIAILDSLLQAQRLRLPNRLTPILAGLLVVFFTRRCLLCTMPTYSSNQRASISQFVSFTQAKESIAAKVSLSGLLVFPWDLTYLLAPEKSRLERGESTRWVSLPFRSLSKIGEVATARIGRYSRTHFLSWKVRVLSAL